MITDILFYLFCIYALIQFLLLGPILVFITNTFFKKYLVVKAFTTGVFLPFFIFYAKDFELKTSGIDKTDIVKLKIKKVFFWINPFYLIIGKIRVKNFELIEPEMKYVNRIPSIQKLKYMPSIGRVKIDGAILKQGYIEIEDRTVFPLYKVNISEIELANAQIDLGIPLRLLFDCEYGYCKIDSGDVLTSCENKQGSLQVQGVTWGKLINLDIIPIGFLKNKIDLDVSFSHDKDLTKFEGNLGQINRNSIQQDDLIERKRIFFKFQADWKEHQMPFDMSLKKMITQLFVGVNYEGAINLTINIIAEGVAKILSKL